MSTSPSHSPQTKFNCKNPAALHPSWDKHLPVMATCFCFGNVDISLRHPLLSEEHRILSIFSQSLGKASVIGISFTTTLPVMLQCALQCRNLSWASIQTTTFILKSDYYLTWTCITNISTEQSLLKQICATCRFICGQCCSNTL